MDVDLRNMPTRSTNKQIPRIDVQSDFPVKGLTEMTTGAAFFAVHGYIL